MSLLTVVSVIAAGSVAGALGTLLGIGGGVFLVPFLNVGLGIDFKVAAATGLMTVIATSSIVSAGRAGHGLINLRLGMLLEIATTIGGLLAAITVAYLSNHSLNLIFAVVTAAITLMMLSRLERRNVLDAGVEPGVLGGRLHDTDTGRDVVYRVKRLPLGMAASFVAGYVSGTLGIGGGILKVPVLNAWCGVPMRAAAATSALMIGVTAAASAPQYFARGQVNPPIATAAVIGVLLGSRVGFHFGSRARVKWLKVLMAVVLAAVSILLFQESLRMIEHAGDEADDAIERLEVQVGRLLQVGVGLATVCLAAGLGLWLIAGAGRASTLTMTTGLVILMVTPLTRVVASLVAYVRLRDWFFVATTVMVFAVLVTAWLLKS